MRYILVCLFFCGSVFAQGGIKKSESEVLKMYGYEKQANRHRKYPMVEIGDSTATKIPQEFKLSGWSDEVWFKIGLESNQLSLGQPTKSKGKRGGKDSVKVEGAGFHHAMFINEDMFEWSIVLEQEQTGHSFTFPFSSNGLTFYWQDTLTDEEVAEGAFRPDSVIHSYAVYHSTRRNNYNKTDGSTEEYTTGKFDHIYRLQAWDSGNDTVWGMINIDTLAGEITLSVDSAWRVNATNPVTIDPTVGLTSQGGTEDAINSGRAHGHAATGDVYTAEASKQVERMTIWTRVTTGSETCDLAVYETTINGASHELTRRLTNAETITITNTTADSLHTGALSVAMIQDSVYSVAWGEWSTTSSVIQLYFDGAGGTRDRQTATTLGPNWNHNSFRTTNRFSAYYTYGDAAAPSDVGQVIIMGQ